MNLDTYNRTLPHVTQRCMAPLHRPRSQPLSQEYNTTAPHRLHSHGCCDNFSGPNLCLTGQLVHSRCLRSPRNLRSAERSFFRPRIALPSFSDSDEIHPGELNNQGCESRKDFVVPRNLVRPPIRRLFVRNSFFPARIYNSNFPNGTIYKSIQSAYHRCRHSRTLFGADSPQTGHCIWDLWAGWRRTQPRMGSSSW